MLLQNQTSRADLLGLTVDRLSMDESVERALELIASGGPHQHVVVNAAKVVAAVEDETVRSTINGCSMVNADGQSVVWASRLLGDALPERVAGIDFMNRLVDESAKHGLRIYLLGAKSRVVEATANAFRERGAVVVGHHDGYWRQSKSDLEICQEVAVTNPDILFIAVPSPFKEVFLADNLHRLGVKLCVGVGGSFDVVAGETTRAPIWMQRCGLEWFYRLLQEPRRMMRRYLVGNAKFIYYVVRGRLRLGS
ncbi:WecB/TagA/CpsF family glycosyltransferase [Paenarthrobacter sp. MSM-2-10-13]|nr:WecB/TagA/CpsF family glycosyltransferase [Paenarthrobacter sp. MSM-2-10-13]